MLISDCDGEGGHDDDVDDGDDDSIVGDDKNLGRLVKGL